MRPNKAVAKPSSVSKSTARRLNPLALLIHLMPEAAAALDARVETERAEHLKRTTETPRDILDEAHNIARKQGVHQANAFLARYRAENRLTRLPSHTSVARDILCEILLGDDGANNGGSNSTATKI